jgi:hypothetical protein
MCGNHPSDHSSIAAELVYCKAQWGIKSIDASKNKGQLGFMKSSIIREWLRARIPNFTSQGHIRTVWYLMLPFYPSFIADHRCKLRLWAVAHEHVSSFRNYTFLKQRISEHGMQYVLVEHERRCEKLRI